MQLWFYVSDDSMKTYQRAFTGQLFMTSMYQIMALFNQQCMIKHFKHF